MTISTQQPENYGNGSGLSLGNCAEGTSARTRPFSFDDIMLRRKSKQDTSGKVKDNSGGTDIALSKEDAEKNINEDSLPGDSRHASNDRPRICSRIERYSDSSSREETLIRYKDKPMRGSDTKTMSTVDKTERATGGKTGRDSHGNRNSAHLSHDYSKNESGKLQPRDPSRSVRSAGKSRRKAEENKRSENKVEFDDRWVYDKNISDEQVRADSEIGSKKRYDRDLSGTDVERSRRRSENESRKYLNDSEERNVGKKHNSESKGKELTRAHYEQSKRVRKRSRSRERERESDDYDKLQFRDSSRKDRSAERNREIAAKNEKHDKQIDFDGRQLQRKSRIDEMACNEPENDLRKRHAEDLQVKNKDADRISGKSEQESGKNHKSENRVSEMNAVKKHDTEKKGKDTTRAHQEESRLKRRRSRSSERRKDGARRSLSLSPKMQKLRSKDLIEDGETPSHSSRSRSGRLHSDPDWKRISSNGSRSYRRHTGSSSGLGGYSPRKRKSDSAAKTPSPTRRSPEKRTAGLDLPSLEKETEVTDPNVSNQHSSAQNASINTNEFAGDIIVQSLVKPIGALNYSLSSLANTVDSVQLTQATRPRRRLYVENLPTSVTDKDLKECINKFLLSSGVSHIQGAQPCISCIMHKEKNQALLEFLTPEDASTALSFDGRSFAGSSLKLRRPKDYIEPTSGVPDKSVAVDSISETVDDSPHKIFVGGISKFISKEMFLEIARAFGPVKACHFEFIADVDGPCAFLEYVDHSVTAKACAGFNGMRLGGQVITAVLATPIPSLVENVGNIPFYGIPEHAKSLLQQPTTVLKLKNVLDTEGLLALSESELEEILDDIRAECSRFGTVRSVNVVKSTYSSSHAEAVEVLNTNIPANESDVDFGISIRREPLGEICDDMLTVIHKSEHQIPGDESENVNQAAEGNQGSEHNPLLSKMSDKVTLTDNSYSGLKPEEDEPVQQPKDDHDVAVEDPSSIENSSSFTGNFHEQSHALTDEMESNDDNKAEFLQGGNNDVGNKPSEMEEFPHVMKVESAIELKSDERELDDLEDDKNEIIIDLNTIFELGAVFVEYRRVESSSVAAHNLHGRQFDGRLVSVGYVASDLYQMKFGK